MDFQPDRKLEPLNVFFRKFDLPENKNVVKARIYMTAHGLYELKVNGQKPDDRLFAPGFTSYDSYLEYQTYDIAPLLKKGTNCIQVVLADGWYKGKFGILGLGENYGDELSFLLNMDLWYDDHTWEHVDSDENFVYTRSPWTMPIF